MKYFLVLALLFSSKGVNHLDVFKDEVKRRQEMHVQRADFNELIAEEKLKERTSHENEAKPTYTEVILSNFYDFQTASGITADETTVIDGLRYYKGRLAIATANTTRLNWHLKDGYKAFELYDEIVVTFNGSSYDAVVIDVCGECFGNDRENLQRIDVYTTHDVLGLTKGGIAYE